MRLNLQTVFNIILLITIIGFNSLYWFRAGLNYTNETSFDPESGIVYYQQAVIVYGSILLFCFIILFASILVQILSKSGFENRYNLLFGVGCTAWCSYIVFVHFIKSSWKIFGFISSIYPSHVTYVLCLVFLFAFLLKDLGMNKKWLPLSILYFLISILLVEVFFCIFQGLAIFFQPNKPSFLPEYFIVQPFWAYADMTFIVSGLLAIGTYKVLIRLKPKIQHSNCNKTQ